ncbi:hypothetical protein PhaeoP97_01010 [Phaeobacter porticola]|uniref:Uncharacterized protein n=1 Tax=Phaeobacter porticola TaxID=1844006 RepID=A0A1L3I314_9RHOB|nr:hypothetical protein PhaeoP97_01010 [Phaeobacter porticola]
MWYDAFSEVGALLLGCAAMLASVNTHLKKNLLVTKLVINREGEFAMSGGHA